MNATLHPLLHDTLVRCAACGSEHALRSTSPGFAVEVCSSCHPAYTGAERRLARSSRIERFEARRRRVTAAAA